MVESNNLAAKLAFVGEFGSQKCKCSKVSKLHEFLAQVKGSNSFEPLGAKPVATKQHLLGFKGENYKSHFLTEYNLSIMTCESIKMLQKCPPTSPKTFSIN